MEPERIDGLMTLLLTLPGVAFTYNGDEIGMLDYRDISWEDTTDPWACNDYSNYRFFSRDPARTPFQWDGSVNAGFNTGAQPWIPVHPNFTEINLERQTNADSSHYKFYKELLKLRKADAFVDGNFLSERLTNDVFGYSRRHDETFVILINTGRVEYSVDFDALTVKEDKWKVILAGPSSSHKAG